MRVLRLAGCCESLPTRPQTPALWKQPASTSSSSSCPADQIDWPPGLRPKSGNITKSALLKLKVADLREELNKRELQIEGTKQELVNGLLEALHKAAPFKHADIGPSRKNRYRVPISLRSNQLQDVWIDGEMPTHVNPDDPLALLHWLHQNATRLQIIFLGTSSRFPTPERNLPSIALRTASDIWLFDVGEDTQRQCLKHPIIRPGKICRIFLTSLNADVLFGLPGVLCTIASSRGQGAIGDQPVHIYGPSGTGKFLASLMELSDTFLEMPVIVHEFSTKPSSMRLYGLSSRAKLWKVDVPPDGLNRNGYYDARLNAMRPLDRNLGQFGKRSRRLNTVDGRAGFRPFELPSPGDPKRYPLMKEEVCWTMMISQEFLITAYELDAATSCFGYRVTEAIRAGSLNAKKVRSYGIRKGEDFAVLKNGGSVCTEMGDVITSDMVLGPDRSGRIVAILGEASDPQSCRTTAQNADYLILPVGKDAIHNTGLTPDEAVQLGKASKVKNLVFGRVNATDHKSMESVSSALADPSLCVTSAFDLYMHVAPSRPHRA